MNTAKLTQNIANVAPDFRFRDQEKLRHRIYDRLLFHLENKCVRTVRRRRIRSPILHEQVKAKFTPAVFRQLEQSILADAEKFTDYEVVRDSPSALYYELKRSGDENLIVANRIVAVPNFILNALVCNELEKEFLHSEVLSVKGFVFRDGYLRLDVDEKHARRGFLMPVIRKGLVSALKVFRYPRDEKPFILRSRKNSLFSGAIY